MNQQELGIVRRAYAKQILAVMDVRDARVEAAFAAMPREAFLGAGPWPILRWGGIVTSPSADPVYLYTDDLVAIDPARKLNNGQPSFHAHLMACAAPKPGEHAVHVGAGLGYYSAILGHLVGPGGQVTAIEYEADLAARARANLEPYAHIALIEGDGTAAEIAPADVIYVNAGTTRPADLWLDRLKQGGRLILPLTTSQGFGAIGAGTMKRHGVVFLITRRGDGFEARRISAVAIYPCAAMRDTASDEALGRALAEDDGSRVRRLYRRDDLPDDICWLRGLGWCLTTE